MNRELLEVVDLCVQCCNENSFYVSFEYNGRINRFEVRIYERKNGLSMVSATQKSHWFICRANDNEKLAGIKIFLEEILKML